MKPLAIDLFCGLGGWTDGLLAEGYDVIGFDIERHEYGDMKYPAQLVLQSVLTLHGSQFKDVNLIVASPPCQAYSYRAMPWSRAKALPPPDNSLFEACFRIQREACEAAGRHIPMIVENVRGANKWVGRSRWNYGSFHLWGDVPALMPIARSVRKAGGNFHRTGAHWDSTTPIDATKVPGFRFDGSGKSFQSAAVESSGVKRPGMNWSGSDKPEYVAEAFNATKLAGFSMNKGAPKWNMHHKECAEALGIKQPGISGERINGKDDAWFQDGAAKHGSKSNARKAASAMIAKIPLPLSRYIGRHFKPEEREA